jgi:hypothetical protein
MNRKRPDPESRAHKSSKKRCVSKYGSSLCMTLRTAPGSAETRITVAIAVRTELRENEIFIYGIPLDGKA